MSIRARVKPSPAPIVRRDDVRKVVCQQLGIAYQAIPAPRTFAQLRSSEWGGIGLDPADAHRIKSRIPKSFEVLGEAAGV